MKSKLPYQHAIRQRFILVSSPGFKHRLVKTALLNIAAISASLFTTAASAQDSTNAAWPPVVKAPVGAPNIVLVLLDDVGYGY